MNANLGIIFFCKNEFTAPFPGENLPEENLCRFDKPKYTKSLFPILRWLAARVASNLGVSSTQGFLSTPTGGKSYPRLVVWMSNQFTIQSAAAREVHDSVAANISRRQVRKHQFRRCQQQA